jgi:hypothetical protein
LRRVFSKSSPLLVTLTWVVKISTTVSSITSLMNSKENTRRQVHCPILTTTLPKQIANLFFRICPPTPVPFVVSALPASEPSVLFPPPLRPLSRLTLFSRVSISTHQSPVLVSRSSARISSDLPLHPSTVSSLMPRLTRARSTRLSSSVVPPVSPESRSSSPITSTERSPTSLSILMRLLHTVLPSRPPFSPVTLHPSLPTRSFFSMSRHCPSVSRLPVVS